MMFFHKPAYEVSGPMGGLATTLVLPYNFDRSKDRCPIVVLMHGFIARKEMYPLPQIAKALSAKGIASIRFDFDAHGKSEGKFVDMTLSTEIEDAKAVIRYAASLPFVNGITLVGHSQGGVIASMTAGELEGTALRPQALVLLAPAAVLKDDALEGRCMNVKYDAANPPEYVNVLFHHLGRKFIVEARKMPIYERSAKYSGKVCIIHGAQDKVVPVSYSEKYHALFNNSELHILPKEGHMLNSDRKSLVSMVVSYLCSVLG